MRIVELKKWLQEEMQDAATNIEESSRIAPKSYGHGYNTGWLQALERVQLKIDDNLDT